MIRNALRALVAVVFLAVLTGLVYPLAITGIAQLTMKGKADGSLIERDGRVVGSSEIGQVWNGDRWFHGRPSAIAYDASTSSGSNLGPSSKQLAADIRKRAEKILAEESPYRPGLTVPQIPVDLLTSSASGLDPDISIDAARFQAARIAAVRGLWVGQVDRLIQDHTEARELGVLGEPRVNVMDLNLALEHLG